jgi:hypothetical protein
MPRPIKRRGIFTSALAARMNLYNFFIRWLPLLNRRMNLAFAPDKDPTISVARLRRVAAILPSLNTQMLARVDAATRHALSVSQVARHIAKSRDH